ncbi:Fc.00g018690.m01.CDS01 [Cosmosporella sp. VM-42]
MLPTLQYLPNELQVEIAWNLSLGDLFQLGLVCRNTSGNATRVLYKKDAAEDNVAILSGARHHSQILGVLIIDLSKSYGGNVNAVHEHRHGFATPLHVAAFMGKRIVVDRLLKYGADVNAGARNIKALTPLPNPFPSSYRQETRPIAQAIFTGDTLPLLSPLLNGDLETVTMLFQAGAGNSLTIPVPKSPNDGPNADDWAAVNIFHLLALSRLHDMFPASSIAPRSFGLDQQIPGCLYTPLHIAALMGNLDVARALVTAGAVLERYDSAGNTALHLAVKYCTCGDAILRRARVAIVQLLLQAGVDPNTQRDSLDRETAVLLLADVVAFGWPKSHVHIKDIFFALIQAGADLNVRAVHSGTTVLYLLLRAIYSQHYKQGNISLETYFVLLVQRGARLDIPFQPRNRPPESLMAQSITTRGLSRLSKILNDHAARPLAHEVDEIFCRWYKSKNWPSNFDVSVYSPQITQRTVNKSFRDAFTNPAIPMKRFLEMKDDFGLTFTGSWERLVWDRLKLTKTKLPEIPFDFDPLFTRNGRTFIHMVIRRLSSDSTSAEQTRAIADIKQFIRRGVPVMARDSAGSTALDLLIALGTPYPKLRKVLESASE